MSSITVERLEAVSTWSAQSDPAVLAWRHGAITPRYAVLRAVQDKLNRLMQLRTGWDGGRAPATAAVAAMALNAVLERVLFDDSPTPQIAPRGDGGVQVEWLVGGVSLEINADPHGQVDILAVGRDDQVLMDEEFNVLHPNFHALQEARQLLGELAPRVTRRVASV